MYYYVVTVDQLIPVDLEFGSYDQVYLRCHPAYESQKLPVPLIPHTTNSNIGMFLYDRVSGVFFTDLIVDEVDTVTLYDTAGVAIYDPINMAKNSLVVSSPVLPDMFLFWDKIRGRIQWDGNRQAFKAIGDSTGLFHLHTVCVPVIPTGQVSSWSMQVETTVDTKVIIELEPNERQVFAVIPANSVTTVNIDWATLPTPLPVERIHILLDTGGVADAVTYLKGWEQDTPTVGYISYVTIAKVSGKFLWGSSGAWAKPYFLKLDYIKAKADLYARLDQGLLVS
jgi:hypothetical protein